MLAVCRPCQKAYAATSTPRGAKTALSPRGRDLARLRGPKLRVSCEGAAVFLPKHWVVSSQAAGWLAGSRCQQAELMRPVENAPASQVRGKLSALERASESGGERHGPSGSTSRSRSSVRTSRRKWCQVSVTTAHKTPRVSRGRQPRLEGSVTRADRHNGAALGPHAVHRHCDRVPHGRV